VMVGWRTRASTLVLWVFVLSIQHRNPLLLDHRDALISCALFWGLLLPWGEALSIDARRRSAPAGAPLERRYVGVPAAGYVAQVACVYLFAALLKDGPEWRSDYTAVARAIGLEYWAQPAAKSLLRHPSLASVLTAAVFWGEAAIAPMLLSPFRNDVARSVAVAVVLAMQIGFGVFLWLDTFPMIAIAMLLGLVPGSLWRILSRHDRSPVAPDTEPCKERSKWVTALSAAALLQMLALNALSLAKRPSVLEAAQMPARVFGLQQNWNMFAPAPTRVDGWFIVAASRADGSAVDLLTGRAVDWSRPRSFREGIRTTRELVYMRRLLAADDPPRDSFAVARCRSTRPRPVSIAVYFMPVIDSEVGSPELVGDADCR
jgi:hypothetical protein